MIRENFIEELRENFNLSRSDFNEMSQYRPFIPTKAVFNRLLSITSVNVTISELTFSSAQLIFQLWSAAGTVDSTSTLAVFDL